MHELLPGMKILQNTPDALRLHEKCSNNPSESLRVLMINTRVGSFALRESLRETYLQMLLGPTSKQESWVYFFSISKPQEALEERIKKEKIRFDDVIIFNTPEGYNITTLRVLASMKLVNCFCLKAVYFIKADDDSYLRIEKLDKELHKLQKQVDRDFPSLRINANGEKSSQGHVLLNSGGACNVQRVPRWNKYRVPFDSIRQYKFPFKYCWG